MSICKYCKKEFHRIVTNGRNAPTYCCRECYDKDHFIWKNATEKEKKQRIKENYERYVVKKEGCWDWNGDFYPSGYPSVTVEHRKHKGGHIVSWEIHNGKIENGLWVLHRCDNPKCTRPDHMFLGTTQDNTADRHRKGRSLKGSEVGTSVLNEEQVKDIKNMLTNGESCLKISRKLNVSADTIKRINKNETWKHVPWPTEKIGNGKDGPRKLNKEKVLEIKKLLKLGVSSARLGRDYGVTTEAIHAIKIGKNWKHVNP